MKLFVGTSGYSYKAWKGHCDPEDLPASKMLAIPMLPPRCWDAPW